MCAGYRGRRRWICCRRSGALVEGADGGGWEVPGSAAGAGKTIRQITESGCFGLFVHGDFCSVAARRFVYGPRPAPPSTRPPPIGDRGPGRVRPGARPSTAAGAASDRLPFYSEVGGRRWGRRLGKATPSVSADGYDSKSSTAESTEKMKKRPKNGRAIHSDVAVGD